MFFAPPIPCHFPHCLFVFLDSLFLIFSLDCFHLFLFWLAFLNLQACLFSLYLSLIVFMLFVFCPSDDYFRTLYLSGRPNLVTVHQMYNMRVEGNRVLRDIECKGR